MNIIFLCKPDFSSATKVSFFIKSTKNNHYSVSDCWECTKYRLKENAKILYKNSTNEESITISRRNLLFLLKTQKATSSASVWWGNSALFLKFLALKKILEFQNQYKRLWYWYKKKISNQKPNQWLRKLTKRTLSIRK